MLRRVLILASLFLAWPAWAAPIEVDLELALMVDVSRSMTEQELDIQRKGYAEALQSDVVFDAVQSGMLQRVAITYVEWAGAQDTVIDWTLVENRADLDAFAETLRQRMTPGRRHTSISGALDYGVRSIGQNGFEGLRKVIDISGDGPNNLGRRVTAARDAAVGAGVIVNGLPLMTGEGQGNRWHLDDLDIYYQTCVVGGPGAFVVPVTAWEDFAEAVRRKLVLEIAALPMPQQAPEIIQKVQALDRDPRDCMIGEKIWQQRRLLWTEP